MHTILVIDDEQSNREIIVEHLESAGKGYKLLIAHDGQMGCKVADKKLPDMIITDWEMPNMTGIEAIRYLKGKEDTRDIPIIMASGAMTRPENLNEALGAGASDFIRKPIEKLELLARTNSILQLSDSFKTIKKQKQELEKSLEIIHTQQHQLIIAERMGAVGEIALIVAHEVNTPLGAIIASLQALEATVYQSLQTVPAVVGALSPESKELFYNMIQKFSNTVPKLSAREERKLISTLEEKLEEEGIDAPEEPAKIMVQNGFAINEHKVWRPLFKSNVQAPGLMQTLLLVSGIYKQIRTIKNAAGGVGEKIKALKHFASRQTDDVIQSVDVNESISLVLNLYEYYHRQGIEIIQSYEELPPVQAIQEQVHLLWTYLLMGAIEEMGGKGTITITTQKIESVIWVTFADTRPEPLDINVHAHSPQISACREIAALHAWTFDVDAQQGENIVFRVGIPI